MNTDVRRRIFVAIMGSGVRTYPAQEPQPCHYLTLSAPATLIKWRIGLRGSVHACNQAWPQGPARARDRARTPALLQTGRLAWKENGLQSVSRTQPDFFSVHLNVGWQEREYNPYYAHLARRLCESKYAFRVTFQFAFWDTFKELDNMSQRSRINVAHLLAHLLRHEGVYMGVFKVRLPHGRVRRLRRAAHGWSRAWS